jgi:ferrous iron transport protein A
MTLTQCEKNQEVTVKKLHAKNPLKQRLVSFGIIKGAKVKFLAYAPSKSTVEIEVGKMKIALRKSEAELVEVEA